MLEGWVADTVGHMPVGKGLGGADKGWKEDKYLDLAGSDHHAP